MYFIMYSVDRIASYLIFYCYYYITFPNFQETQYDYKNPPNLYSLGPAFNFM
jgi:hypothetical protein